MAITFSCGHCGKTLTTTDDKAGRKAKCPGCGEVLTVPDAEGSAGGEASKEDSFETDDVADDLPAAPSARRSDFMKACPMCGEKNPRNATKCEYCGEELKVSSGKRSSSELGHEIIDLNDVLSATWEIYKQNLWVVTGIGLVCIAIVVALYLMIFGGMIGLIASMPNPQDQQAVGAIINLASLPLSIALQFLIAYLNAGVNKTMLKISRGEEATVGMMFSGGPYTLRAFLIGFLYNLLVTFGIYCCFVPGIILQLIFWPYLFIIVDEDCGGIEAMNKAKEITTKNWLSVFVLGLLAGAVGMAGAVTCIGLPFAVGFSMLLNAVIYCKMTGQRTAA